MKPNTKINCYKEIYNALKNDSSVKNLGFPEKKDNLDFFGDIGHIRFEFSLMAATDLLKLRGSRKVLAMSDEELLNFGSRMTKGKNGITNTAYDNTLIFQMYLPFTGMPDDIAEGQVKESSMSFVDFIKKTDMELEQVLIDMTKKEPETQSVDSEQEAEVDLGPEVDLEPEMDLEPEPEPEPEKEVVTQTEPTEIPESRGILPKEAPIETTIEAPEAEPADAYGDDTVLDKEVKDSVSVQEKEFIPEEPVREKPEKDTAGTETVDTKKEEETKSPAKLENSQTQKEKPKKEIQKATFDDFSFDDLAEAISNIGAPVEEKKESSYAPKKEMVQSEAAPARTDIKEEDTLPSTKQELSNEPLDESAETDTVTSDKKGVVSSDDPEEDVCAPTGKNMPLRKPSVMHAETAPMKETPVQDAPGSSANILEQMETMYLSFDRTLAQKKEQLDFRENLIRKQRESYEAEKIVLEAEKKQIEKTSMELKQQKEQLDKGWNSYNEANSRLKRKKELYEAKERELSENQEGIKRHLQSIMQSINDKSRNLDERIIAVNAQVKAADEKEEHVRKYEEEVKQREASLLDETKTLETTKKQLELQKKELDLQAEQIAIEKETIASKMEDLHELEHMISKLEADRPETADELEQHVITLKQELKEKEVALADSVKKLKEAMNRMESLKKGFEKERETARTALLGAEQNIRNLERRLAEKDAASSRDESPKSVERDAAPAPDQADVTDELIRVKEEYQKTLKELESLKINYCKVKASYQKAGSDVKEFQNEINRLNAKICDLKKRRADAATPDMLIAALKKNGIRASRVPGERKSMLRAIVDECRIMIDADSSMMSIEKVVKKNYGKDIARWNNEDITEVFYQNGNKIYCRKHFKNVMDFRGPVDKLRFLR